MPSYYVQPDPRKGGYHILMKRQRVGDISVEWHATKSAAVRRCNRMCAMDERMRALEAMVHLRVEAVA